MIDFETLSDFCTFLEVSVALLLIVYIHDEQIRKLEDRMIAKLSARIIKKKGTRKNGAR